MPLLRASALLFFAFFLSLAPFAAQPATSSAAKTPAAPTSVSAPASIPAPAPPPLPTYTDLLKPSLSGLRDTLSTLRIEKWKNGSVRAEAEHDTASIVDDLNEKVPDLLKNADASPYRVAAALALTRNFAALYDVSLRVLDASRIAAPADQAAKIQDALNSLAAANRALYDRLEKAAAVQETHIGDLETKLKAQQQAALHPVQVTPPPPDCPAPPK
ncbi:MAG TPA: hypothetical protein VF742_05775, partial [Terracidiphilus sp.]